MVLRLARREASVSGRIGELRNPEHRIVEHEPLNHRKESRSCAVEGINVLLLAGKEKAEARKASAVLWYTAKVTTLFGLFWAVFAAMAAWHHNFVGEYVAWALLGIGLTGSLWAVLQSRRLWLIGVGIVVLLALLLPVGWPPKDVFI